ncbi:50S ribosomal protein L24 [Candidatus Woesearchaeota archaeon CG_4_10_14_0_2_um_filter_33_10]|nr:MAG: 50S ribosomal protein L24 [Candidatus Woesearchaeota archaeon CG1_02_33_12]PIN78356.1 MAG: 50S ribosomal protein L24 [Candidatus Woesearchaeota archaeon CG10_big_fil_rev_8_21_14_0_10_33_12]PIU72584.1 MAG: 50S ribosomal protein L24 [Candidatus Woesearchaeota archaeon CG06_land_8_20_14_3_00_33_13]PIZ53279.1 MAG: 50S ribosomal protein L24 [Candidatus Woesearchaeota archaeon CG_4_10_14_0_2_um_filter_33_10]
MKKKFSREWIRSKQPRKQRKYNYNAPLHIKGKFMAAHLSKDLMKKYNRRSIRVRKGDKVILLRGQFKKKKGNVERVDLKKSKVYISGVEMIKKDGTKVFYPIHPSNLVVTELNLDDKKRIAVANKSKKADKIIKEQEGKK